MTWFPGKCREHRLGPICLDGGGQPEVKREPVEQTQTTTSEPWEAQRPFLERGFEAAQGEILNNPLQFFPGQTYVNFSPETLMGLNMQTGRAMNNPLLGQAQQQASNTLAGDYLANPYMDQLTQSVASEVMPAVQGGFGRAGRTGTSPSAIEAMSRGITRGVAPTVFDDYRRGRTEMERASALAPGLSQADYYDIAQLRDVGAMREAQQGRALQDQMARHEFSQYEPYTRLPAYMGLVQGNYGGTTQSTGTGTQLFPYQQSNPLLMGLGAASSLAGIGGSLFGGGGLFSSGGIFG